MIAAPAFSAPVGPLAIPKVTFGVSAAESPKDVSVSLQIIFLLTILTLAPSIVMMMTSFTRIVIVLSLTRNALGTQQMPPNQVMVGLALFLTFFVMAPVLKTMNDEALQPYMRQEITHVEALKRAENPIRKFMFKQTRRKDLTLFVNLARMGRPKNEDAVPTYVLIPAFIISEMKSAFEMGFIIYIPFLVIDMVVSSTLMSMGMLMLPPIMISLPFKILIFIMIDGWALIARGLVLSFRM
ncbi:MAG TPA: flagellar type III secretion system pore protein FliP [bacterium]|nr:flagellar type III secretion system pore protein FliP [bacterium]